MKKCSFTIMLYLNPFKIMQHKIMSWIMSRNIFKTYYFFSCGFKFPSGSTPFFRGQPSSAWFFHLTVLQKSQGEKKLWLFSHWPSDNRFIRLWEKDLSYYNNGHSELQWHCSELYLTLISSATVYIQIPRFVFHSRHTPLHHSFSIRSIPFPQLPDHR